MAYRSTKEKAENRTMARKLYTQEGYSLEDISQTTGETVRTLKAWCKLGQWDILKNRAYDPDRDRLRHLRTNLLDRIEAQFTDGKLPHTEIGLLTRVDTMLARHEAKAELYPGASVVATLQLLIEDLQEHDPALLEKMRKYFVRAGERAAKGGFFEMLGKR